MAHCPYKAQETKFIGDMTILRKQDDSIANLWNSTIEGKRPVGRPRSRWKDQVMKDKERYQFSEQQKRMEEAG